MTVTPGGESGATRSEQGTIRYRAAAKRAAGIGDGTEHPPFGTLPEYPTWRWDG